MAGVDSIVAEELDVNIIAHTGDFTTQGTSHEEKCVTVIKNKVGDKVKVIGVLGNHDRIGTTDKQAEKVGIIMPVDKAVDIKGLTFVGQHDPTYNIFGGDRTSAQGHKTAEKTADKLSKPPATNGLRANLLLP